MVAREEEAGVERRVVVVSIGEGVVESGEEEEVGGWVEGETEGMDMDGVAFSWRDGAPWFWWWSWSGWWSKFWGLAIGKQFLGRV